MLDSDPQLLTRYGLLFKFFRRDTGVLRQSSFVLNFPDSGSKMGTIEEPFSVKNDSMQKSSEEF